ncbi:hypothetical protein PspLS_08161, partial [Pyricularia sp. CBS 133598]
PQMHCTRGDIASQRLPVNNINQCERHAGDNERSSRLPPQVLIVQPECRPRRVLQFCRRKCLRVIRLCLTAVAVPSALSYIYSLEPREYNSADITLRYQNGMAPSLITYFSLLLIWDMLRMLHYLYPRAPGSHLEAFFILEASITIMALACSISIPIMARFSKTAPIGLLYIVYIVFIVCIMLISALITIRHARWYPQRRRQRRDFLTRKPTLAFRPDGTPLAVYLSSEHPVRTMSVDSLLDMPTTKQSTMASSPVPSLDRSFAQEAPCQPILETFAPSGQLHDHVQGLKTGSESFEGLVVSAKEVLPAA